MKEHCKIGFFFSEVFLKKNFIKKNNIIVLIVLIQFKNRLVLVVGRKLKLLTIYTKANKDTFPMNVNKKTKKKILNCSPNFYLFI